MMNTKGPVVAVVAILLIVGLVWGTFVMLFLSAVTLKRPNAPRSAVVSIAIHPIFGSAAAVNPAGATVVLFEESDHSDSFPVFEIW